MIKITSSHKNYKPEDEFYGALLCSYGNLQVVVFIYHLYNASEWQSTLYCSIDWLLGLELHKSSDNNTSFLALTSLQQKYFFNILCKLDPDVSFFNFKEASRYQHRVGHLKPLSFQARQPQVTSNKSVKSINWNRKID